MSHIKEHDHDDFESDSFPCIGFPSQLIGCIPDGLPVPHPCAYGALDTALTRYYVLQGIVDDDVVGEDVAAADRANFAHMRTPGSVEFSATVEFMHAASGLPWDWCVTWTYLDDFATAQSAFADSKSLEEYVDTTRLVALDMLGHGAQS